MLFRNALDAAKAERLINSWQGCAMLRPELCYAGHGRLIVDKRQGLEGSVRLELLCPTCKLTREPKPYLFAPIQAMSEIKPGLRHVEPVPEAEIVHEVIPITVATQHPNLSIPKGKLKIKKRLTLT